MPLEPHVQIALAIAAVAEEHGAPNGISPGELEACFNGPAPVVTGWHLYHNRQAVAAELAKLGLQIVAYGMNGDRKSLDFDRV